MRFSRKRRLLTKSGGTSSIYSEAYRRQHALGAASSVQRSIKALQEQGLVDESSPGEYQVPENAIRSEASSCANSSEIFKALNLAIERLAGGELTA